MACSVALHAVQQDGSVHALEAGVFDGVANVCGALEDSKTLPAVSRRHCSLPQDRQRGECG